MIDTLDERAIDLEFVERERLQVAQARIAGAEIVHGNTDAKALQAAKDMERTIHVLDQYAFRDLELEARRVETGLKQDRLHEPRQVALDDLDRRKVDRDAERLFPACRVLARSPQDLFAELQDHA